MAVHVISKTLRGSTYQTNTLPTSTEVKVLTWVLGLLGQSFASIQSKDDVLATSIGAILSRLDQPKTVEMCQLLLSELSKDGKPIVYEIEFSANLGVMTTLLYWILEENLGSFLEENDALQSLLAKLGDLTQDSQTSTSQSGA